MERRVALAAGWLGIVVAATGLLVLFGWWQDIDALRGVLPGLATMKANTAACFVLAGVALWCLGPASRAPRATIAGRVLAALVGVVAILTLVEYGSGRDLGIETLLVAAAATPGDRAPGRMAVMTAVNFTLIAAAMLLLDVETAQRRRPSNWLAFMVAVNAYLALLGYLYGVEQLYRVVAMSSVALHTALLFLVASLAVACSRPESAFVRRIAGDSATAAFNRRLIPMALVLIPLVGALRLLGEQRGYYESGFGLALFALSNVLIILVLGWWGTRALGASNDRLRAILETEPECVKLLAADGSLIEMNQAGLRMLEADTLEQVRNQSVYPLIVERDRTAFRQLTEKVLKGGSGTTEFEIIGLKGGRRWLETNACPLRDGAGAVTALLGITRDITERKRAEQRLLEAQRIGRIGDWEYDRATGALAWSAQVFALYGRDPALGPPSFDESLAPFDEPSRERATRELQEVIASGQSRSYDLRLRLPDGTDAHHAVVAVPIPGPDGAVAGVRGIVQDVTARKRSEERVRESEHQLRSIVDGLGEHMFVGLLDLDGIVLMANEPARAVAELREDHVVGLPVEDTYWFADSGPAQRRVRDAVRRAATGEHVRYDDQIRVGEGQHVWIDFSIHPLRDQRGDVVSLVPSAVVIHERKLAEAALRREEELLRLIVEHSPAAIAMFDRDMRYIVASRRYRIDYALGDGDLAGRSYYDVFPRLPDRWKALHRSALAGATELAAEDLFQRDDGQFEWLRWELRPWREASGEIGGILLFSELITERKHAEQKLRDAAERQQALSRRLVEVQEIEQRRLSAELHDRIGQNLTALSINLNIIGHPGVTTDAGAKRLRDSRDLLESTIALVRDLIADLRPVVLDDYGLLAGLRWFGEQARQRLGVELAVAGAEPEPRLSPQVENALFRIAQEAVTNVAKHARAARIDIRLHATDDTVCLDIEDDGRGFEPALATAAGPQQHWGLEMMAERAEAVGARLRVDSSPGRGCLVQVKLPLRP